MINSLEDTDVTYEELAEIEREFDDVEKQIIRQEMVLSAPIYARRAGLISKIPNFWSLVLEQAPPEIDRFIQITDGELLLGALTSISVVRFEPDVDPRSVLVKFEFAENKYFEDKVLEKKFWWRTARNKPWCGLVSEAVSIKWKSAEVDLTDGLLDLVLAAEKSISPNSPTEPAQGTRKKNAWTPEQKALHEKIEEKGISGLSFFTWFGYIGNRISAEESAEVEVARRDKGATDTLVIQEEEEDEEIEDEDDLEIFPDGGEVATAFSEDLWPDAIKYFTQAQEQDSISDLDFESIDETVEDEDEEEKSRVTKKRKPN